MTGFDYNTLDRHDYERTVDAEKISRLDHTLPALHIRVIAPCFFRLRLLDAKGRLILVSVPEQSITDNSSGITWYTLDVDANFTTALLEWSPIGDVANKTATIMVYQ